jgi:hypothetical protein
VATTETPPESPPVAGACPRCGTPHEPYQEYCLQCGLRLPVEHGLVPALRERWTRRVRWYPGDWMWPTLLALVVAAAASAVAIGWAGGDETAGETLIRTEPLPTTTAATTTTPVPTEPTVPTFPTQPPRTQTQRPGSTQPPPPPPPRPTLVQWPRGKNGYTVVIASIPAAAGREPAIAKAREALRKGVEDPGVIESGRYSSLHPGYYVVFAGIYDDAADAQAAVPAVRSRGFPAPYVRQIAS